MITEKCRICNGTGKYLHTGIEVIDRCHTCRGSGIVEGNNYCKYCGDVCYGYFCKSCAKDFKEEREMEVEE